MSLLELAKAIPSPANVVDRLNNLANKYIVKPKAPKAVYDFVFDYEGDVKVSRQSEITDHYAEDNSVINDHIALKPLRITLRGYAGELVKKPKKGVVGALDVLQDRLSIVPAYLQDYTPGQLQVLQAALTKAQKVATSISFAFSRVNNIVGRFDGSSPAPTRLKEAYSQLSSLMEAKMIFSIETPFHYHDNMVIESLELTQPEDTKSWADITITLKELRFVELTEDKTVNRNARQRRKQVSNGNTQGTPKTKESTLYKIFG